MTAITTGSEFSGFAMFDISTGGFLEDNYDPACISEDDAACHPTDRPEYAVRRFEYNAFGDQTAAIDTYDARREFTYDDSGNQKTSTFDWVNPNDPADVRTVTTQNVYDEEDRVTQTIAPDGTTSTDYDDLGRAFRTTDKFLGITEQTYDARGLTVQTTAADGKVSHTVYDQQGRAVWSDDPHLPGNPANGTKTMYDDLGRVTATERYADVVIDLVDDPLWPGAKNAALTSNGVLLSTTSSDYDDAGRVASSTNADNHTTTFEYDKAGRQIAVEEVVAGQTLRSETEYDTAGRQILVRDALLRETHSEYDDAGNLVRTIFADSTFTTTTYDTQSRRIAETDPLGLTTDFEHDKHGNLTAVVLPEVDDPESATRLRPRYEYVYDTYGNLATIRDAKLRETTFEYDELNRQVSRTLPPVSGDPTVRTETKTYDSLGRQETITDFMGQVTEFVYSATDPLGRLEFKNFYTPADWTAGTPTETVEYVYDQYDGEGERHDQVIDARGTTDYEYNVDGRLITIAAPEGTIHYEYDSATGRHTRTYTNNTDVEYGYDSETGRLQTVSLVKQNGTVLGTPLTTTYSYDAVGNLDQVLLPNNVRTDYDYDELNRITRVKHEKLNDIDPTVVDHLLADFQYDLRDDGKRDAVTEIIRQDDGTNETSLIDYVYDEVGRLAREDYGRPTAGDDLAIDYVYDIVGNRLEKNTSFENGDLEDIDYSYNELDQLLQEVAQLNGVTTSTTDYTYDDNGSVTSKITVGGDSYVYTYNLQNRLYTATIDRTESGQAVHIEAEYQYNDDDNSVHVVTHRAWRIRRRRVSSTVIRWRHPQRRGDTR